MLQGGYYQQLLGRLSEDDLMAVVLSVKDWKAIAEHLRLDADAEGYGPAVTALHTDSDAGLIEPTDEAYARAISHDAEHTACHQTCSATERCADVISETLRRNGWPD